MLAAAARRALRGGARARWTRPQAAAIHASRACLGRVDFKLADIGEGIAEVEVLQWFVKPGDDVKQFDKICEVQSDKATVEITSRYDGRIEKVLWEVGDMATVGSTLVEMEVDGVESKASADSPKEEAAPEPTQRAGEDMVEIATPPRALERSGSFTVDPVIRPSADSSHPALDTPAVPSYNTDRAVATPAVRRLARDHDLDLAAVPATGKGGRVLKGDVLAYLASVPLEERRRQAAALREQEAAPAGAAPEPAQPAVPRIDSAGPASAPAPAQALGRLAQDQVVPVKGIQRIMVKSMEESLKIPHFNYMEEYDFTEMTDFRNQLRANADRRGVKLSYMPIIIKAASLSLVQHPGLNAHFNAAASEVVQKASHNIGVAMDTPRGLLVPVIRDCQQKSIIDIAQDLVRLQALGADNKLGEAELTGGTFTLSNIGAIGGTYASPVIPAPTVLIGAIGRMQTVPRFRDLTNPSAESLYAAKVMNMSWAADHRVVDGATVARFSNQLKSYIESPLAMVADLS